MDKFVVEGGRPLLGTVRISGSKNAALPILFATLLTDEPCVVCNVPDLRDIRTTMRLLEYMGKRVGYEGGAMRVEAHRKLRTRAPYDLVKQMRASALVAGPLLARFGEAHVPLPGGCTIGVRPIDIHLKGFEAMGAKVGYEHGDAVLSAAALRAGVVRFKFPSVGATENLMMAAALTPGTTVLRNAAREPEIEDLASFLIKLGARVTGAGTSSIRVQGTRDLHGAEHTVIPDRIETGTFLLAAATAGGDVRLEGAQPRHLTALIAAMRKTGARVDAEGSAIRVRAQGRPRPVRVRTMPHPGFPTDLQAPWMAYMCLARGRSRARETVFENRFIHAAELLRMGARIALGGDEAVIDGVGGLHGAPVMASDIRAGAALVVAALAAKGSSVIERVYHIDRGYERIERKLRGLGARIRRVRA